MLWWLVVCLLLLLAYILKRVWANIHIQYSFIYIYLLFNHIHNNNFSVFFFASLNSSIYDFKWRLQKCFSDCDFFSSYFLNCSKTESNLQFSHFNSFTNETKQINLFMILFYLFFYLHQNDFSLIIFIYFAFFIISPLEEKNMEMNHKRLSLYEFHHKSYMHFFYHQIMPHFLN